MFVNKFFIRSLLISSCLVNLSPAQAMDEPPAHFIARPALPSPEQIETAKATYQEYKKFSDEYCAHFINQRKVFELDWVELGGQSQGALGIPDLTLPTIINDLPEGKVLNVEEREFMEFLVTSPSPLTEFQQKCYDELHSRMVDFFLGEKRNHREEEGIIPGIVCWKMKLSGFPSYNPQQTYNEILFNQLGLTAAGSSLVILDSNFLDDPDKFASHGYKTSQCATIFAKDLKVIPVRWKERVDIDDAVKKFHQEEELEKYIPTNEEVVKLPPLSDTVWWEELDRSMNFRKSRIQDLSAFIKENQQTLNFMTNLENTLMDPENREAHVISISINPELLLKNDPVSITHFSQLLEENDLLLTFSAGNNTLPLSDDFQRFFKSYPGLEERILFVGSHDKVGDISYFSNRPGKFDEMFIYTQGEYDDICGTSYAAPLVGGFIASLKAYFPETQMKTLKKIVLETTDPFPDYIGGYDCIKIPGQDLVNSFHARQEIVGRGKFNPFNAFLKCYENGHSQSER